MTQATTPTAAPSEGSVLAREAATSFGRLVENYEKHFKLTRAEAFARATDSPTEYLQSILHSPPDQESWCDLYTVEATYPEGADALWESVKQATLEELQTGHRAAQAVEGTNLVACQRAQFLALRTDLAAQWQPRNGIERQLLDTAAQAQAGYLHWL